MSEKIPCYMLCYNEFVNFRTTFEFFQKTNLFAFHTIENPSPFSRSLFMPYIQAKIESGDILSHYFFDDNITTNAYDTVFRLQLAAGACEQSPYIMITDSDILPLHPRWVEEEKSILETYPEVMCVSMPLLRPYFETPAYEETDPCRPVDRKDYFQQWTGWWGSLYRTQEFYAIVQEFMRTGRKVYDWHFQLWSQENNRQMASTKMSKCIHLTDYNYLDDTDSYGVWKTQQDNSIWLQNTYSTFTHTTKDACVKYELNPNSDRSFTKRILYSLER